MSVPITAMLIVAPAGCAGTNHWCLAELMNNYDTITFVNINIPRYTYYPTIVAIF